MIVFNGTIGACAKRGAWQRAYLVLGHLKTEDIRATVAASAPATPLWPWGHAGMFILGVASTCQLEE